MKNQGPKINFKAYKNGHFLELVIKEFGLKSQHGRMLCHRGPCPICCKDKPTSRYFAVEFYKGVWYCHRCGKTGDALELWAKLKGVPVWQAAHELSAKDRTPVPYLPVSLPPSQVGRETAVDEKPGLALGNGNMTDECPTVKPLPEMLYQGTFV